MGDGKQKRYTCAVEYYSALKRKEILLFIFWIGGKLLHSVVLVSTIQQCKSVIIILIHISPPLAQTVKNLPAIQETWVWSLGWEDPLEKGNATHSGILAWRIPWTVSRIGGRRFNLWATREATVWSMGSQRVGHDWVTFTFTWASWFWYLAGVGGGGWNRSLWKSMDRSM